jgi:CheY-like chemotaxis protein
MVSSNRSLPKRTYHILLADDDGDDCFFFKEALSKLPIPTQVTTVDNGERLLTYLTKNSGKLPDVVFLDLNMPRKNGADCLKEIKLNKKTQHVPVIIYSTYLHDTVADQLYKTGAHYYIRKSELPELRKTLKHVLTLLLEENFERPSRDKFILNIAKA